MVQDEVCKADSSRRGFCRESNYSIGKAERGWSLAVKGGVVVSVKVALALPYNLLSPTH